MKCITNTTIYKQLFSPQSLPSNYKKIDCIVTDGNQYIDTGVVATSNMSCSLEFEFIELPQDGCLIGTKLNGGNRLYFYHYYNGHKLGYGGYSGSGEASIGTKYKVDTILNKGYQELKVNEEVIYTGNNNIFINNKLNYYLFDLNSNNTDANKYKVKVKLYYCNIYDGPNLIRSFIPVKNLETNELGLFDLVNQVFYNNLGTGTFN